MQLKRTEPLTICGLKKKGGGGGKKYSEQNKKEPYDVLKRT